MNREITRVAVIYEADCSLCVQRVVTALLPTYEVVLPIPPEHLVYPPDEEPLKMPTRIYQLVGAAWARDDIEYPGAALDIGIYQDKDAVLSCLLDPDLEVRLAEIQGKWLEARYRRAIQARKQRKGDK